MNRLFAAALLFLGFWRPCAPGQTPQVETAFRPKLAPELIPMAREAMDDFDHGKYADAEHIYDRLIARDPNNPYLLSNQGVVFFRESKLKSAEAMLKKSVAVAPKDAFNQASLAIVYDSMRNYDAAVDCLIQVIQIDPKNAAAHDFLGIASRQNGWPEGAIEKLQKAVQAMRPEAEPAAPPPEEHKLPPPAYFSGRQA